MAETSLLADRAECSNVEVYYEFINEYEPDTAIYIIPNMIVNEMPEVTEIYFDTGKDSVLIWKAGTKQD